MQLGIVHTKEYEGMHLFLHQLFDFGIIISLIRSTKYQDQRSGHAMQGIPTGVYIRSFRVVDKIDSAHTCHFLQTMFHPGKVAQRSP